VGPSEYADLARAWRDEGAQIIGGCCGTTPEHIEVLPHALAGTKPGRRRPPRADGPVELPVVEPPPWRDEHGHRLYPLEFPQLMVDKGVFVPTQGSFLCWKYLFSEKVGTGRSCLDVGCGSGILAVQLALNGAQHVHAIDIERDAVANTLANAFRNGVADRVSGEDIDLYEWEPHERYDVVVASLYQMPVDPFGEPTGHRPLDYWGRSLIDHLIRLLPEALADDGTAYLLQLSIIGERRTTQLLDHLGYGSRVVDFGFFEFTDLFEGRSEQISRVEELSDAYHLKLGHTDVMVAYLLEITRKGMERSR
jgi:SAM-dependent methyltransferase